MKTSERNHSIDALRGLAIVCVILFHCYLRMPIKSTWLPHWLHTMIFMSGYYGVIIFFVISGFLITRMSLRRFGSLSHVQLKAFYAYRFARIAPCLIALLMVLSLLHTFNVSGFVIKQVPLWRANVAALSFHINWLEAKHGYLPANWDVLWSLSVEEVFYLFFPLWCFLLRQHKAWLLLLAVFILLGPPARVLFSQNEIWQDHGYLSCFDAIAMGCLAALVCDKPSDSLLKYTIYPAILLFVVSFVMRHMLYVIGLTQMGLNVSLLALSIALLLMYCSRNPMKQTSIISRLMFPLSWYGRYSYELYLTHLFIVIAVMQLIFPRVTGFMSYLMVLITSAVLAYLVARFFSEPLNRYFRKRLITSTNKMKKVHF